MQMLGLPYLMVSKQVACPPLKITNLAFLIAFLPVLLSRQPSVKFAVSNFGGDFFARCS